MSSDGHIVLVGFHNFFGKSERTEEIYFAKQFLLDCLPFWCFCSLVSNENFGMINNSCFIYLKLVYLEKKKGFYV